VALCGERYEHLPDRQALRAGHVASSLVLGGRRVAVQRPRARSVAGRELRLPSWREWSARDPLEQRAVEQMVLGVSTRGYARSLEPLPEAVAVRGVSKSAVSERFVYGTERKLTELMSRELCELQSRRLVRHRDSFVATAKALRKHDDQPWFVWRRRPHRFSNRRAGPVGVLVYSGYGRRHKRVRHASRRKNIF
jgi:hypothetical protein